MTTLTDEQIRHYAEQGYVLVSGLVPEPVAQEAADPTLLACYTPALAAPWLRVPGGACMPRGQVQSPESS